jgi:hypothetical protein
MKRKWIAVLVGASLLAATDAEAQRGRVRESDERNREAVASRVERLAPVRAPGRVVATPAPRARPHRPGRVDGRAYGERRVVYRSGPYRPRAHRRGAWIRVDWRDGVYFRAAPLRWHRAYLDHGDLRRLLGRRAVRDIREAGFSMGLRGALRGHWIHQPGVGTLLVVTMGGTDVAELVDYDRDGFIDDVFLIGPHPRGGVAIGW